MASNNTPMRGRGIVAIDTGGTFTDLVAYDPKAGSIAIAKSLTTYGDLFEGVGNCLVKAGVDLSEASVFKHGTTLVINALLERKGGPAALVATRGFRDILEIARGNRPETFDLFYRRHKPLIPRHLRFEITERMDSLGRTVKLPTENDIRALAEELLASGVKAVGISFLNAYLSPAHEDWVADRLTALLPGVFITTATGLSREWYEYERTATAAANAYVGPRMVGYLSRLADELAARGFPGHAFMMGSNGGVLALERAAREPIALVESGPIGGCIGAAAYGEALGVPNLIAFDMGGTTAKSALVRDGGFDVKPVYYVGGYERGFPIRGAVIDIVEVGAGGGSIASLDGQNRLSVGPRSAGSEPGPVAYGKGGTEPTVTDANLVLGRLDAQKFLGGEMGLDLAGAQRAIAEKIAKPLGLNDEAGTLRTAAGILAIASVTMAGSIRKITVERGRDPRDFALFAYGGGGPLHAVDLARELHIPQVIIPPEPGNFSAIGMLLANARQDSARTFLRPLEDGLLDLMEAEYQAIEAPLRATLASETGVTEAIIVRYAELRYRGQVHSAEIGISGIDNVVALRERFENFYEQRYGHADRGNPVELVGLRSTAAAKLPQPDLARLRRAQSSADPAPVIRDVCFGVSAEKVPTRIYQRDRLPSGFSSSGPALIQEYGSTTMIGPLDSFVVGDLGEIRITIGRRSDAHV